MIEQAQDFTESTYASLVVFFSVSRRLCGSLPNRRFQPAISQPEGCGYDVRYDVREANQGSSIAARPISVSAETKVSHSSTLAKISGPSVKSRRPSTRRVRTFSSVG